MVSSNENRHHHREHRHDRPAVPPAYRPDGNPAGAFKPVEPQAWGSGPGPWSSWGPNPPRRPGPRPGPNPPSWGPWPAPPPKPPGPPPPPPPPPRPPCCSGKYPWRW